MRKRSSKISFWVSDSERKRIKNLAGKTGMGEGEYLRLSALGKTIFQIEELKPMLHDLKGVSRNLNQLTMLAHEGRVTVINLAPVLSWLERNYPAATAFPITVATAAPTTPHLKPRIKIGSRIRLSRLPMSVPVMAFIA